MSVGRPAAWAARGAAAGVCWGLGARAFMRLFSEVPEFSWAGTLTIIGLCIVLFTGLALVRGARLSGRRRWWRLAPLPGLVLFAGPGMLLLPAVLGGLAGGRARRAGVRAGWVGLGVLGAMVLAWRLLGVPDLGAGLGLGLFAVCALALALGMAEWTRPWRSLDSGPDTTDRRARAGEPRSGTPGPGGPADAGGRRPHGLPAVR